MYNSLAGKKHFSERDKEITKRCLVQFDKKEKTHDEKIINEVEEYDSDYEAKNPEEEWVEYVDYLGRTRQCQRRDLELMQQKDTDLKPAETTDLSKNRQEWEKQEQDLLNKQNIHYQDLLFNEARSHGVGYYSFSKNEEERIKQQINLNKLRQETKQQQELISEQKKLREKQMADRLRAARNRKRARIGLPPEEEIENVETALNEETKEEDAEKGALEKAKEAERKKYIRPWDIGKEILKQHHEYSQEEWVEIVRNERRNEFAPPTSYSKYDLQKNEEKRPLNPYLNNTDSNKQTKSTNLNNRNFNNDFNFETNQENINEIKGLYFTTKKKSCDNSSIVENTQNQNITKRSYEAEETSSKRRKSCETNEEFNAKVPTENVSAEEKGPSFLEADVVAGLRYLREQAEKSQLELQNFI